MANTNINIELDPFWEEALENFSRYLAFDSLCRKGEEVYKLAERIDNYVRNGEIDDDEIFIDQHLIFFYSIKNRHAPGRSSIRGFINCCNRLAFFDESKVPAHCRWVFRKYFKSLNEFCKAFVEYRQKYVFNFNTAK